jgi:hypothetical protein
VAEEFGERERGKVRTEKGRAKEGEKDEETRWQKNLGRGREVKLELRKGELKKERRMRREDGRRIWEGGER